MAKLPAFTPTKIEKILKRKGFILDRSHGSHRIYSHPETKRKTVVPFHKRDLPRGTFMEILKQAGITRRELDELLNEI